MTGNGRILHIRARAAAVFALLLGLCLTQVACADAGKMATEKAVVVTADGSHAFDVEIADKPDTRTQGLMFRKSLADRAGMLFFYDEEQHISMWMRNTYISLDMIFIKGDGTVHRVEEGTEPFSERVIESGERVLAVLEVKAGIARSLGLKPGDRVEHPRFTAAKSE